MRRLHARARRRPRSLRFPHRQTAPRARSAAARSSAPSAPASSTSSTLERDLDARERALLERLLTYGPREPPARSTVAGHGAHRSCRASARSRPGRARPPTSRRSAGSTRCGASSAASSGRIEPRRRRCTRERAARAGAPLFDRMTETVLLERARGGAPVRARADAPVAHRLAGRRPRCARESQHRARPRAVGRRDRLPGDELRGAEARSRPTSSS